MLLRVCTGVNASAKHYFHKELTACTESLCCLNFGSKLDRTEYCCSSKSRDKWATSWRNQQNDCAPSEDSDQPGHPPILIRVFTVRMKKAWVPSYPLSAQRRLWSDWADAHADLSLCWAHSHFAGFVMRRLKVRWHTPWRKLSRS